VRSVVLEHALLPVPPERRAEFEAAFAQAVPLIRASPGFRRLDLLHSVEHPGSYLLLVEWERLEDHTEGFRGSPAYAEWRRLLHGFYDPLPEVGHATGVLTAEAPWPEGGPGVVVLPSGRRLRGRGLRRPLPDGPLPGFAVHLVGRRPPAVPWESRWVRWPDFRLPADPGQLRAALAEARERATTGRVELACGGGRGRTGTALACLAVLDGVPADEAVAWVRARYDRRAVETRAQQRFVRDFG
jgi:heme-degrading monooxygenase HmoA